MRNEIYHTPGPWRASPTAAPGWHVYSIPADVDVVWTEDMTEADAALIAAAPELLEVVEGIARTACLRQFIGNKCICWSCKAKAAIAKAKGF
jgi:hypothetical protein